MQSRIRYLDNEHAKMQKKVDQTRRLAEKMAVARDLAEEKLGRMVRLDEVREAQQREVQQGQVQQKEVQEREVQHREVQQKEVQRRVVQGRLWHCNTLFISRCLSGKHAHICW